MVEPRQVVLVRPDRAVVAVGKVKPAAAVERELVVVDAVARQRRGDERTRLLVS